MGLSTLLSIGKSALNASQVALQVTGNNISNVDTTGYSRQTAVLLDSIYVNSGGVALGTGVTVSSVVRAYDAFVEAQYLGKLSSMTRWDALSGGLSNAGSLFNESNTSGINAALSTFYSDWQTLTGEADSSSTRETMLEDTQTMLSLVRSTGASLSSLKSQTETSIAADVDTVNQLAQDIASLNKQINETQVDDSNIPNSLYDERDKKIEQLAALVDVNVIDNGKGNLTVNTKAGQTIVDDATSFTFKFEQGQTVRQLSSASIGAASDVQAYYDGTDSNEYTLKVVSGGAYGAGATFQVSLDGGKTWLTSGSGAIATYSANLSGGKVKVGDLDIWFGTTSDPEGTPSSDLNVGDTFTLVPKKALYWYTSAGTPVNVTPQQYADGTDNTTRLTGGALTGEFLYRDVGLATYQKQLDAMTQSMIWEVNRIHSQGAGLTGFDTCQGTYAVSSTSVPLGGETSGLAFGDRLASGASMLYVYASASGSLVSGKMIDFSSVTGSAYFDPDTDTLENVVDAINDTFGTYLTASIVNNKLSITANAGYDFQFGDDSTGLYAALGLNTLMTGTKASDVAINSVVQNDTNRVCVGHVGTDGLTATGDNTTAKAMAALEDTKVDFSVTGSAVSSQTISGYYASIVGKVGTDAANASYQTSYQTTLASQLANQKLAVSAVNLDEELTNMIKFQHSYQAAAKLISTADTLMDTVLSLKN